MKKIFMDLEMNPIDKSFAEERKTCTMETIEIGAICLNEQNEETGNFCEYVKPQYSAGISSRYQKLTGITTEMVQDASPFADVLARFADWCGEGDYTIWSWSDSDIWQILKETDLKHIEDTPKMKYMLNHWRDFQQEFGSMMHITKAMKLERAVSLAGLDFSGRAHDGLTDARNTACLYQKTQDKKAPGHRGGCLRTPQLYDGGCVQLRESEPSEGIREPLFWKIAQQSCSGILCCDACTESLIVWRLRS